MKLAKQHTTSIVIILVVVLVIVLGVTGLNAFYRSLKDGEYRDYVFRAETAIDETNYHDAFVLLEHARLLKPKNTDIVVRQAEVAFLNGDYTIALTMFKQVGVTQRSEIMYIEALRQLPTLDFEAVHVLLTQAITITTKESVVTTDRIQDLDQAVQTISSTENILLQKAQIAKILVDENALFEAEQILTEILTEQPKYRDAHYLLGVTYLKKGQTLLAKQSLEQALSIDPNYEPARILYEGL